MNQALTVIAIGLLLTAGAQAQTIGFADAELGALPSAFQSGLTGDGDEGR